MDEFQDTGWFLGRAVSMLLQAAERALIVGDPDQSIYQFVGADRTLFDTVEKESGVRALPLNESHRCAKRICTVATALSRSKKDVVPRGDAADGKALLFVYAGGSTDSEAVVTALSDSLSIDERNQIVVLSRRARKDGALNAEPWQSGSPSRLAHAMSVLANGDARQAAQLVSRELAHVLLDVDTPTPECLAREGN